MQMKKIIILTCCIISFLTIFAQQKIPLTHWSFRQEGTLKQYPASVPGTIHTDLLANKLIDDPFFGHHEKSVHWVDTCSWIYETTVDITQEQLDQWKTIDLVFEGLDTYADVFLNEILVGCEKSFDNMFVSYRIPLKNEQPKRCANDLSQLRVGTNTLKVVFHSALKEMRQWKPSDYLILDEEPRAFVRKAQYQFGWDWGPKFVTMGIWKPVYLQVSDSRLHFGEISLRQAGLRKDEAHIELTFTVKTASAWQKATVCLKEKQSGRLLFQTEGQGDLRTTTTVTFPEPKLWYPNGMGEPHLYDFVLELYSDGKKVDSIEKRLGFKDVQLKRAKDEKGERFYFLVNGKEVFMKGANWVPAESFLPRLTVADYDTLVAQAAKSNFNMLRVWGGGIYESEAFYDACDKYGILVWQDFAFACALYPATTAFLENVKQEAIENIRRISQHASLALWCGNNENDEGWHNWGWKNRFGADSAQAWQNYVTLFRELLPSLVEQYDPQHSYLSSSPVFGWGKKESMTHGDSHYWGIWWGMEPFDVYNQKVPRFMSEYGFQGFLPMNSLKKCIPVNELYLGSPSMKAHQKHPKGYETIQTYMEREYHVPKDLETYNYVSQLLQAYGMKTGMDAHRRAKPYCMGSLYWQYNDCWPVVSWSGIDYYKQWKALQYFVKKSFAQHAVSFYTADEQTGVWLITDSTEAVSGVLQIRLYDFDGKERFHKDTNITLQANSSQKVWSFAVTDFIPAKDTNRVVCQARFVDGEKPLTEGLHYFALPKNTAYPDAKIHMALTDGNRLTLQSDKLVKNICILIKDSQSGLSDNFFDMLPNQTYTVEIPSGTHLNDIKFKTFNRIRVTK